MIRFRTSVAAIMACTALLNAATVNAEPRARQSTGAEPVPDTEMNAWLGRMVDKFRFEGVLHVVNKGECEPACVTVEGTGDCIAIAAGPGLQCILNATWQEMWDIVFQQTPEEGQTMDGSATGVFELPGGVPYLDPAMALFGTDPGNSAIHYLLVNNKGMPEGGPGFIKGNRATFTTECVNEATLLAAMRPVAVNGRLPETCERTLMFEAKPDSRVVWLTIEIEINEEVFTRFTLTLRRQPREAEESAAASS